MEVYQVFVKALNFHGMKMEKAASMVITFIVLWRLVWYRHHLFVDGRYHARAGLSYGIRSISSGYEKRFSMSMTQLTERKFYWCLTAEVGLAMVYRCCNAPEIE